MSIKLADAETTQLRFKIGSRVECNCGTWKAGTVVKLFYAQKSFPEGMCVPYQVQLDDGKLIFAPADVDRVVRAGPELVPTYDDDEWLDEEVLDADKLPVTVVTGFLGSGKTTLINHILTEKHGVRVCVIENEFGSVDIDTSLVKENMNVAEEIISLDNGCACCTVRGDLMRALGQLKARRNDFDLLLLETTGMANPAPVVATFTQNPSIANNYRVDGVIALVDAKHVGAHLREEKADDAVNEAVCQVAFADRILVNKVDLVTKEELDDLKDQISSINSFAEIYETERSKVDLSKLLNISAFSIEKMEATLDEFEIDVDDARMDPKELKEQQHAHGGGDSGSASHEHGHAPPAAEHAHSEAAASSSHEHGHSSGGAATAGDCVDCVDDAGSSAEHGHQGGAAADGGKKKRKKKHDLSGVGSLGLTCPGPLISHEFNAFMSELLRTKAADLYRSKGVLAFVEEGDAKFIFQGVHEQIQYTQALEPWQPGEAKVSKVVFIGRNLDHDMLRAGFTRCQAGAKPEQKKGFLSSLIG